MSFILHVSSELSMVARGEPPSLGGVDSSIGYVTVVPVTWIPASKMDLLNYNIGLVKYLPLAQSNRLDLLASVRNIARAKLRSSETSPEVSRNFALLDSKCETSNHYREPIYLRGVLPRARSGNMCVIASFICRPLELGFNFLENRCGSRDFPSSLCAPRAGIFQGDFGKELLSKHTYFRPKCKATFSNKRPDSREVAGFWLRVTVSRVRGSRPSSKAAIHSSTCFPVEWASRSFQVRSVHPHDVTIDKARLRAAIVGELPGQSAPTVPGVCIVLTLYSGVTGIDDIDRSRSRGQMIEIPMAHRTTIERKRQ